MSAKREEPGGSMSDLFRVEVENQAAILNAGLLELERGVQNPELFETLMRAAHSLKGAGRIMNLQGMVQMAHSMENCFVAAQEGSAVVQRNDTDRLFRIIDLMGQLSRCAEESMPAWESEHSPEISELVTWCEGLSKQGFPSPAPRRVVLPKASSSRRAGRSEVPERVLRVSAENLNRLLGLAGESLVESRWLRPFADSLQALKRQHLHLSRKIETLRYGLPNLTWPEQARTNLEELSADLERSGKLLTDRLEELESFDRRSAHLSHRLYLEVLRTRMRPFGDGVRRFPRMVRDLARSLGKDVRLEIYGESTQVDREILERLEAPLSHLIRNAVDHGCQTREDRDRAGKSAENVVRLEARHNAGMLLVSVSDDGRGVHLDEVRAAAVHKGITDSTLVQRLTDPDLLELLLLPGFTLRDTVTEISGRGVGLDVVQNMVRTVRGSVRLFNQPGRGLRVQLQLPQTLSVLRTLLVEIGGEPYAIPLNQISSTLTLKAADLREVEGRRHFMLGKDQVGLISAHDVLECEPLPSASADLPVVVLSDRNTRYGVKVEQFLGQRELVVQPLDERLGKIAHVSAAALMEDGSPVLILDTEEVTRTIERLVWEGAGDGRVPAAAKDPRKRKRILLVDDSPSVREFQQKTLAHHGYAVDVAFDGVDAWNCLHSTDYALVITDIDMPRLDGISLTAMIKKDPSLKSMPVLMLSYKDRDEDRSRGKQAGADLFLTKDNSDSDALVQAVLDLAGEPQA